MNFAKAVRDTRAVRSHLREGLKALREVDRNRLHCSEPRNVRGSVNLEEALPPGGPGDARWDYGIGIVGKKATSRSGSRFTLHPREVTSARLNGN